MIRKLIPETAQKYVGQKELQSNSGFYDFDFWQKMKTVGFKNGLAWCSLVAELWWKEAYLQYKPELLPELDKLFSEAATKTYTNFKNALWQVDKIAEPGALVIWQHYEDNKPTWKGHVGIVTELKGEYFQTIEGNTNADGSREGDQVAVKCRKYIWPPIPKGLALLGFVHPKL